MTAMLALAITSWVRYGGGEPYPDLTTSPLLDEGGLEHALSFGPDGWSYVADSAPQEVLLRAQGPYRIFRFRPGAEGVPGQ